MKKFLKDFGTAAIICILFFSVLGFFKEVPANEQNGLTDGEVLMRAFQASKGNLESTKLDFWSEIKNKKYTQEEMEKITLGCAKILGLEKEAKIDIKQDQNHQKVTVTAQEKNGIYATILMENWDVEGQSKDTYFLVDISLDSRYPQPLEIEKTIVNYFTHLGLNYEYSMTMIGTFDEKMNTDIMRGIIENTFTAAEAQALEGIEEDEYSEMISLSGYSPQIQNSIKLSGRKMNINGAMRYNDYDKKTYIWIGIPLIATEY